MEPKWGNRELEIEKLEAWQEQRKFEKEIQKDKTKNPEAEEKEKAEKGKKKKSKGSLIERLRKLVSGKKVRFVEDGYNLDLTYITLNVIAMGFPSAGVESAARNKINDVRRFFKERHHMQYRIYNL